MSDLGVVEVALEFVDRAALHDVAGYGRGGDVDARNGGEHCLRAEVAVKMRFLRFHCKNSSFVAVET